VIEVQRATKPLLGIIDALSAGFDKYHVDIELQRHLRDARDHVLRIVERIDVFRALLQNALTVNATLVGQRQNDEIKRLTRTSLDQNEDVKRISAWAAILFAPTLVGTIYGMNFSGTASSAASAWLSIVSALHHQQLTVASCRSKRWPPVWSRSPATIRATAPSGRSLVRFPS
jgi:Mg2+ and Co2+ transporter CorA